MTLSILAIDPGASGGYAIVHQSGATEVWPMLDEVTLRDEIAGWQHWALKDDVKPVAYLEQVGGFIAGNPAPGSAMFNFGDGYGYIRGLLAALHVETRLVRPQVWQAGIPGIKGVEKSARKRALKEHAARIFPNLKVTLKTADALCIADYARRQERSAA